MSAGVAAIVPAAGVGRRLGASVNKPYIELSGKPLLAHTLLVLQESPEIRWIILVTRQGEERRARAIAEAYAITKLADVSSGGASRGESVAKGFSLLPKEAEWVLVHDGARPCLTGKLIARCIHKAKRHGAVACGMPAMLTVKAVDEQQVVRLTLDREHLWFVQTPQVFRSDWFGHALARAGNRYDRFPDDAAIIEAGGFPVRMVLGDPLNLKVTTQDDLLLAEAILDARVERPRRKKPGAEAGKQKSEIRTRVR